MSGIFNIIVGLVMVAAGLSGKFSFLGTGSPGILVAVGAVVTVLGIYQAAKRRSR